MLKTKNLKWFIMFLMMMGLLAGQTAVTRAADSSWQAKYWNNKTLSGEPVVVRQENNLYHDWGNSRPDAAVDADAFSARWTRSINFTAGTYRFTATMDDGMRVWVDNVLIINSWWDSQAHALSYDLYLNSGDHQVKVEYYEAGGGAVAKLDWIPVGGSPSTINNWRGEYFNNMYLSGQPALVRDDAAVNFNWGSGTPVLNLVPSDRFSVRWTRSAYFANGRYRFTLTADDGVRLWVNNQLLIDGWYDHPPQTFSGEINLFGAQTPLRVEYYDNTGGAQVQLSWTTVNLSPPLPPPAVPPAGPTAGTGTVVSPLLNVRTGPGTQYPVLHVLSRGQTVPLAGYRNAEATWVMINWSGSTAWVSGLPGYLATAVNVTSLPVWSGTVPNTGGPTTGPTATISNVYYLNLRTGPGTTYSIIKAVPSGTTVTLLERNSSSTWAKVRLADGSIGWMNAFYLTGSTPIYTLPLAS